MRPVPRSGRSLWWYIVPGIILLAVGIGWMMLVERRPAESTAPYAAVGTSGDTTDRPGIGGEANAPLAPAATGPRVIGDMALLADKDRLIGHSVELANVRIADVNGARSFWIGSGKERTLVLLNKGAADGPLALGQSVQISGRVENAPQKDTLASSGITDKDAAAIDDGDVLIRAARVRATAGPEAGTPR